MLLLLRVEAKLNQGATYVTVKLKPQINVKALCKQVDSHRQRHRHHWAVLNPVN